MTDFKLGKKPATYDKRDLLFVSYEKPASVSLPHVPKRFGHGSLVSSWGMLGNDQYGDCVFAGSAHETMLWNAEANHNVSFNDTSVLSDYSAVTGFNPANPNSDQGTEVRQALDYRRSTGVVDATGTRHKIGGYVALEPGNWDQLLQATYIFSAVGIGIEFPGSAMDQFNQGKPWSVVPGASIEGGHYIPVVGHPSASMVSVVTWAEKIAMTRAFYEKYCDEAYAILSEEMLSSKGKSREHFDLAQLQADLAAL
jgi:hypothetical protein